MGEKWTAKECDGAWEVRCHGDVFAKGMKEEDATMLVTLLNAVWHWELPST
jgi:phage terminase large subunit-like protein